MYHEVVYISKHYFESLSTILCYIATNAKAFADRKHLFKLYGRPLKTVIYNGDQSVFLLFLVQRLLQTRPNASHAYACQPPEDRQIDQFLPMIALITK